MVWLLAGARIAPWVLMPGALSISLARPNGVWLTLRMRSRSPSASAWKSPPALLICVASAAAMSAKVSVPSGA